MMGWGWGRWICQPAGLHCVVFLCSVASMKHVAGILTLALQATPVRLDQPAGALSPILALQTSASRSRLLHDTPGECPCVVGHGGALTSRRTRQALP